MIIRREQVEVLKLQARKEFVNRTADHLKACFCENPITTSAAELRKFIEEGIGAGGRYGISSEYDVRRFIELQMEYGAGFHQRPWAAKVLNEPSLGASARMDRLDDYTLYVLRDA